MLFGIHVYLEVGTRASRIKFRQSTTDRSNKSMVIVLPKIGMRSLQFDVRVKQICCALCIEGQC